MRGQQQGAEGVMPWGSAARSAASKENEQELGRRWAAKKKREEEAALWGSELGAGSTSGVRQQCGSAFGLRRTRAAVAASAAKVWKDESGADEEANAHGWPAKACTG